MRLPSAEQAVPSCYTCNSQPKAAETNLVGMPVTLGALARNITYDNAARKFILEVSLSAVADIIKERFNMSDLVAVRPLPFEDFVPVVKEVAKRKRLPDAEEGSCRR